MGTYNSSDIYEAVVTYNGGVPPCVYNCSTVYDYPEYYDCVDPPGTVARCSTLYSYSPMTPVYILANVHGEVTVFRR